MCEEPWALEETAVNIWASCSRNMPGRTDSTSESGRATAPPNTTTSCDLPRYPGSVPYTQYSHHTSGESNPSTPRYTPNYASFNLFSKKPEDQAKHQQESVTDSLLSFLQKKTEECAIPKESSKRRRKDNAMSHYPDEGKRLSGYDYHQWDYRAEGGASRRSHLPFCGAPQGHGWGPMAMAGPYFPNPHMVPAHAHSTPDYRFNQWTPPSKLQHAHSQPKLPTTIKPAEPPLLDPLNDLQALVTCRDQQESVDLRLPAPVVPPVEKPVQLTVPKPDDKEISSTIDAVEKRDENLKDTKTKVNQDSSKDISTANERLATNGVEQPKEEIPDELPPAPSPVPEVAATPSSSQPSKPPSEDEKPAEPPLEPSPNAPEDNSSALAPVVTQSEVIADVGNVTQCESSGPEEVKVENGLSDSLPTVSSTSTDVKPSPKEGTKKKKPAKKRKALVKKDTKKTKVVKPVKAVAERRGPVLHIKGTRDAPVSVSVFNGPRAEEDDGASLRVRPQPRDYRRSARARNGLFSSTLSARYDARTPDPTWICVFCKQGPHRKGLGDLFGPYIVERESKQELCDFSGDENDIVDAQRRGGRNKKSIRANNLLDYYQKMSKKLKRSRSLDASQAMSGLNAVSDDESDSPRYEVWVHEACAVWSPGVFLVHTRLVGLQEAVWHCQQEVCSKCGLSGANLGCIHRNCPNRSHYACAEETGWSLASDTFISTCHFHVQRS